MVNGIAPDQTVLSGSALFAKVSLFVCRDERVTTIKLQWLEHRWLVCRGCFELLFESSESPSDRSRKQILRDILKKFSYFIMQMYFVYPLESLHQRDFDDKNQHSII